ncbi:hypothetical protein AUC68_03800 [Methyloceanibacter methanicus]|uniref:Bacteriophage T5 Orf172 DNA-binding domain-containing protein n=1 Tax=Methyloceanibacter methanicus TaxID=1774968 RepID=A0A1E3W058_9HYPH|nr:GIY-YIG nuclease family protein [Methyloceanibacter methanicus]ODR99160.1 hypothetical protein AUC68_03800 [Methyloceanibacter methanicus]
MFSKKHILDEIRRTATENGGVPLGRERFARETGIKPYYIEKYWARLSDAQREAGFEPNSLQGGYDADFLLEKFVDLIRELGQVPTQAALRVKHSSDDTFPSPHTFAARLGRRGDLIQKALAHCEERSGYEDAARLCNEALTAARTTVKKRSASEPVPESELGFVYLLKSGRYYKIGKTNSAGRRERELAIQLPEEASTIHVIKTDDPAGIERYWHHRFAEKRKQGEWFNLDSRDVRAFRRRKFM